MAVYGHFPIKQHPETSFNYNFVPFINISSLFPLFSTPQPLVSTTLLSVPMRSIFIYCTWVRSCSSCLFMPVVFQLT